MAYAQANTDPLLACQPRFVVHLWSKYVPVYQYEFNYQDAPYYFPHMPGFVALASHTIDIQFLFQNWHGGQLGVNLDQTTGQPRELDPGETALSDQLIAFWTNFASTGNPNKSGNSPWPKFTRESGVPAILSEDLPSIRTFTDEQYAAEHHCAFWDPILGYPH